MRFTSTIAAIVLMASMVATNAVDTPASRYTERKGGEVEDRNIRIRRFLEEEVYMSMPPTFPPNAATTEAPTPCVADQDPAQRKRLLELHRQLGFWDWLSGLFDAADQSGAAQARDICLAVGSAALVAECIKARNAYIKCLSEYPDCDVDKAEKHYQRVCAVAEKGCCAAAPLGK